MTENRNIMIYTVKQFEILLEGMTLITILQKKCVKCHKITPIVPPLRLQEDQLEFTCCSHSFPSTKHWIGRMNAKAETFRQCSAKSYALLLALGIIDRFSMK